MQGHESAGRDQGRVELVVASHALVRVIAINEQEIELLSDRKSVV